jgi:hypothetical protein
MDTLAVLRSCSTKLNVSNQNGTLIMDIKDVGMDLAKNFFKFAYYLQIIQFTKTIRWLELHFCMTLGNIQNVRQ